MNKEDLILEEVRKAEGQIDILRSECNRDFREIFAQLRLLNFKSTLWGAGGGALVLLIAVFLRKL